MATFDCEKIAKGIAEKALDVEYEGRTIRQWVEEIKNYTDVKTEVVRLRSQVNHLKKYDEQRDIALHARLVEETKQKVAREISANIKKAISNMKYNANTTRKTVNVEELKEQVDWVLHEVVPNRISEVINQYIGGE